MNYTAKKINVKSSDGKHTLAGIAYIPSGEVKGLFHIVHGMTEHIGRYEPLMSAAAERGYVCFGYDNLGHGKTADNDSELGFIAHKNGWQYLVDDTFYFQQYMQKLYPDKPLYIFGHSMGSFIVRVAALKYGNTYKKLIICGTGGPNPASDLGILIINIIKVLKGEKYISVLVDKIAFGAYNKRFDKSSKYNWLTKDTEIIKKYSADKFCTFKFTVSAMKDLVLLQKKANVKDWFENIRKNLPILLISGSDDPVGNYGKGVNEVYKKLKNSDVKNVSIKLYENCRHEILNDTCKAQVTEDIFEFLEK